MTIKMFTVVCPVHGEYEVSTQDGSAECPERCILPSTNGLCDRPLQRKYDAPAVHYKGSGWASKEK